MDIRKLVALTLCFLPLPFEISFAEEKRIIRFEVVESLAPKDFWNSWAESKPITSTSGASISFWRYDSEDAPYSAVDDQMKLAGFVGMGLGDLGEFPVFAKVWANFDVELKHDVSQEISRNSELASAIFSSFNAKCSVNKKSCDEYFLIVELDKSGTVTVDGKYLDQVR